MKTIEIPVVVQRPVCLSQVGGEADIVACADYFIQKLVLNAPAVMTAEYSPDGKKAVWEIRTQSDGALLHTEEIKGTYFRSLLARLAFHYMNGHPYRDTAAVELRYSGASFQRAFDLGNDGRPGYWFKAFCPPLR